jgi:hypothetical protein
VHGDHVKNEDHVKSEVVEKAITQIMMGEEAEEMRNPELFHSLKR